MNDNDKHSFDSDKDVFSQEEIEELEILDDDDKPKKKEVTLPDFKKVSRKSRRFFMKAGRILGVIFGTIGAAIGTFGSLVARGIRNSKPVIKKAWKFVKRYRYYFIAGLIAVCAIVILMVAFVGRKKERTVADPMAGLTKKFEIDKHKDVNKLIEDYHTAYASGDVAAILTYAKPVSDAEQSYIKFFSEYIEGYDNIVCYTKRGLVDGAYLVSVTVDMKFSGIESPAQGLEFYYVQPDAQGNLYIDNLYSSFNLANEELEQDASVKGLIDAYEASDDVQELAARVEKQCAETFESDPALENFVNVTLQQKISAWAVDYVAAVQSDRLAAIEGIASKNEDTENEDGAGEEGAGEDEMSIEESIAQAQAEDEAELEDVKTNASNVNVRKEPDKNSDSLGKLERGTQLVRISYSENGWSKVEYEGTEGYIRSEFLDVVTPEGNPVDEPQQEENDDNDDDNNNTGTLKAGDVVEVHNTVNVRSKADQTSDRVGVAHPGDKVTVVAPDNNGWTKVKWNNKQGYIKTDILQ